MNDKYASSILNRILRLIGWKSRLSSEEVQESEGIIVWNGIEWTAQLPEYHFGPLFRCYWWLRTYRDTKRLKRLRAAVRAEHYLLKVAGRATLGSAQQLPDGSYEYTYRFPAVRDESEEA